MRNKEKYIAAYDKHKNLKLAAEELGIKWQKLYVNLRDYGHPVTGDKERYGSEVDKFACATEDLFKDLVPIAVNLNDTKFQAKMDFKVGSYSVDVKASTKKDGYKNNPKKNPAFRWAFSCKVQEVHADFLVCFCFSGDDIQHQGKVEKILLIPAEFFKNKQSLSVSCTKSKWYEFEVTDKELTEFFQ